MVARSRTPVVLALLLVAALLLITHASAAPSLTRTRRKFTAPRPVGPGRGPNRPLTTRRPMGAPICPNLPVSMNGDCGPKAKKKCPRGQCCSQMGYCGIGAAWCGAGCQSSYGACSARGACGGSPSANPVKDVIKTTVKPAAPKPTPAKPKCPTLPVSTDFACGKNGRACPAGYCCSEHGYCGVGADWCGAGCQAGFGSCDKGSGCFVQPIKATAVRPQPTKAPAPVPPPPPPPAPVPPSPPPPPPPAPVPPANPSGGIGPLWSTMPRSWCYEVLLVRTDAQGNLYCEANYINTGCNWRSAEQRGMNVPNPSWFPVPRDWIGYADWASLAWYDTHGDSCAPFCDRMKPKKAYLEDQDGQGCYYGR